MSFSIFTSSFLSLFFSFFFYFFYFFYFFTLSFFFFFFFQAEDGIRDRTVTGVQTCALPISACCGSRRGSSFLRSQPRRSCPGTSSGTPCHPQTGPRPRGGCRAPGGRRRRRDRKSTRLNSSHRTISYAVFCLKKKKSQKNK